MGKMEIYSPSARAPKNFSRNQPRKLNNPESLKPPKPQTTLEKPKKPQSQGQVVCNSKVVATGTSVNYVIRENTVNPEDRPKRKNPVIALFDFLKEWIVDRMNRYFEFEDRYEERMSNKTWINKTDRSY